MREFIYMWRVLFKVFWKEDSWLGYFDFEDFSWGDRVRVGVY